MKKGWHSLAAAVQLLTRIPLPVQVPFDPPTLASSLVSFPIAGLFVGLLTAGAAALLDQAGMPMLAAALTLGWWIALTGGLHLDGWMDTADGVLSGRSREKMLDIMKDSRVGAMGVIAGVLLLLVKFAALYSLFGFADGRSAWLMFAAGPVWSRWWMTIAIVGWPGAREGGMGAMFRAAAVRHAAGSTAMAAVLAAIVAYAATLPWDRAVLAGAIVALSGAASGLALAVWFNRKLGGLTGDTYGAMNEAAETASLIALCFICQAWIF